MKNYIKPTFTLAGLVPMALAAGGCDISELQKEDLEWMFGEQDWSKLFVDTTVDTCDQASDITGFCKMAYATDENYGYEKIFGSF